MFEFVESHGKYYPIPESGSMTDEIEARSDFNFPHELKAFYREIGCGKVIPTNDRGCDVNGLMGPLSCEDFRKRAGIYETIADDLDFNFLESEKQGQLFFFKLDYENFFSIEMNTGDKNSVFYNNVMIAGSLVEFLTLYISDTNYYRDIYNEYLEKSGMKKHIDELKRLTESNQRHIAND